MKTFAEIQNGVIVNVSVWDLETPQSDEFVEITDIPNASIGWSYLNGEFIEPEPVTPSPLEPATLSPSKDIPVSEV
jgi:hypothetical protein